MIDEIPVMPMKMLSVLRTTAGKRFFQGVLTPRGWRLRSRTTGRFVSVDRALGFARGIGRTITKLHALSEAVGYLSNEFVNELIRNRELRDELMNYLRASAGYTTEEIL